MARARGRALKIGHKELAEAQRDVRRWVSARLAPGAGGPRSSYAAITREGIFRYHRTGDLAAARAEVRRRLGQEARFKSLAKKDEAEYQLVEYAAWCEREGLIVADCRVTIDFSLGSGMSLGGQLSRVDAVPATGQYRGVLLGAVPDDWPDGFRFPLLQRALARMYQRDEVDVLVGVQELTGENLVATSFTPDVLDEAERMASVLAADIVRTMADLGASSFP